MEVVRIVLYLNFMLLDKVLKDFNPASSTAPFQCANLVKAILKWQRRNIHLQCSLSSFKKFFFSYHFHELFSDRFAQNCAHKFQIFNFCLWILL